jgi:hypothetical protein
LISEWVLTQRTLGISNRFAVAIVVALMLVFVPR